MAQIGGVGVYDLGQEDFISFPRSSLRLSHKKIPGGWVSLFTPPAVTLSGALSNLPVIRQCCQVHCILPLTVAMQMMSLGSYSTPWLSLNLTTSSIKSPAMLHRLAGPDILHGVNVPIPGAAGTKVLTTLGETFSF